MSNSQLYIVNTCAGFQQNKHYKTRKSLKQDVGKTIRNSPLPEQKATIVTVSRSQEAKLAALEGSGSTAFQLTRGRKGWVVRRIRPLGKHATAPGKSSNRNSISADGNSNSDGDAGGLAPDAVDTSRQVHAPSCCLRSCLHPPKKPGNELTLMNIHHDRLASVRRSRRSEGSASLRARRFVPLSFLFDVRFYGRWLMHLPRTPSQAADGLPEIRLDRQGVSAADKVKRRVTRRRQLKYQCSSLRVMRHGGLV